MNEQTIVRVILWTNGQVMVFNLADQQMPEYQGHYGQVKDKIMAAYRGSWELCEWEVGQLATFNPAMVSPLRP